MRPPLSQLLLHHRLQTCESNSLEDVEKNKIIVRGFTPAVFAMASNGGINNCNVDVY